MLNKKAHTVAHVAANAHVLKVLYEFGFNLFVNDAKQRNALFFASFFGRVDCIVFLLEIAFTIANSGSASSSVKTGSSSPSKVAVGSGIRAAMQLSPRGSPKGGEWV